MIENSVACQKLTMKIITIGATRNPISTSDNGAACSHPIKCRESSIFG